MIRLRTAGLTAVFACSRAERRSRRARSTPAAGFWSSEIYRTRAGGKAFAARFDPRGRRLGATVLDLGRAAGTNRHAFAAAGVQRDGKIVLAAGIQGRVARMYRLLPNGRPDPGFGKSGVVALTLP